MAVVTAHGSVDAPSTRRIALPVAPLALTTLWDMYVGGVRPFDLVAAAALLTLTQVQIFRGIARGPVLASILILLAVAVASVVGVVNDIEAVKPVMGVVLGAVTAMLLAASTWSPSVLIRGLQLTMVVHGSALVVQLVAYYATGSILNFHAWLGIEPRLLALFFRPAGLFQEPAHYCLMMFGLLTLARLLGSSGGRVEWFGITTMLMSLSLWGIAAALIFVTMYRPAVAGLVAVGGIGIAAIGVSIVGTDNIILKWALGRLERLDSDGSAQARYGGLLGSQDLWRPEFWFGHGIMNDYLATGSSSLSFLLSAGGVIAVAGLVAFWLAGSPPERRWRGGAALALMLTAASMWTTIWWWAWLALTLSAPRMLRHAEGT